MPRRRAKDIEIQATLEESEVPRVMRTACDRGPLAFALTAWSYEFGARVSEPGMQLVRDVDLRLGRARPAHLKGGKKQVWQRLMVYCTAALPAWLAERETWRLRPEQQPFLFPSRITTGRCYACAGTGQRQKLKRDGERRFRDGTLASCAVCHGTGKRWGLAAQETYAIVKGVLVAAGIPDGRNHPHTLRHSIITHLLNAGASPKVIQDRVGHRSLETTLGYACVTDQALDEMQGKLEALGVFKGWK